MTYMFILKCALKLVEEIILYYDARSKKQKKKDGKIWLRRPKLYKGVVEPYKKKKMMVIEPKHVGAILM